MDNGTRASRDKRKYLVESTQNQALMVIDDGISVGIILRGRHDA